MKKLATVVLFGLSVVVALPVLAQTTQQAPEQQAAPQITPSDPRLQQIVQLVRSGLSESLIAESIQKETVPYNLTPQDLLYLKENRVPESIIAALLAVEAPASPGPGRQVPQPQPAAVAGENSVEGLVLRTGRLRRNRPGTLVFVGDKIEWRDATDASLNAEIFPAGIRKIELKCRTAAGAPFCFELEIDIARGDSFRFEDANKDTGGNLNILALRDAFKARYPRIPIEEKVRRR
ncbi:MAG: hypothetical protein HRF46_03720 [Acidobacteriota bacterium]|jgi:hypothetical protein